MRMTLVAAACLLWPAGVASAQDFIEGVWLSSAENCAQARSGGIESVLEEGNLALTASGLHGYEYHCDFVQVLKGVRTPGWTVTALCEEPGFAFSDLITIMPRNETQLDLVSLAQRQAEDSAGGIEEYVACEGVELP